MLVVDQVKPLVAEIQSLLAPAQAAYVNDHNAQVTFFNNNLSVGHIPSAALISQLQADQATTNAANTLVLNIVAYALTVSVESAIGIGTESVTRLKS